MPQLFLNNCRAEVHNGIGGGDTILTVTSVVNAPTSLNADDFFLATLFTPGGVYGTNIEVVKVTAVVATVEDRYEWTIERGQEGTAAVAHPFSDIVEARLTAGSLLSYFPAVVLQQPGQPLPNRPASSVVYWHSWDEPSLASYPYDVWFEIPEILVEAVDAQFLTYFAEGQSGTLIDTLLQYNLYQEPALTTPAGPGDPVGGIDDGLVAGVGLSQTTAASQPLVVANSTLLAFDGVDDFLDTGVTQVGNTRLFADGTDQFYVAVAFRIALNAQGSLIGKAGTSNNARTFQIYFYGTNDRADTPALYVRGSGGNRLSTGWDLDDGQPHVVWANWDGSTMTYGYDDQPAVTMPSGTQGVGSAAEETTQRILVGARSNGASFCWDGDIGSTVIRDVSLPVEERTKVAMRLLARSTDKSVFVLGSSTAEGNSVAPADAYASRFNLIPGVTITNVANGGTDIGAACPTGYSVPAGWDAPDPVRNVTYAIDQGATDIIINFANNFVNRTGGTGSTGVTNYMNALAAIKGACDTAGVNLYVCQTAPRAQVEFTEVQHQTVADVADAIRAAYQGSVIFNYAELADTNGYLKAEYDSGDGIHPNAAGHAVYYGAILVTFQLSEAI